METQPTLSTPRWRKSVSRMPTSTRHPWRSHCQTNSHTRCRECLCMMGSDSLTWSLIWTGSLQSPSKPQVDSMIMKGSLKIWAATWQNQHCGYAPSEDSDQPGHLPSLIRVFAARMKKPWVLSYPLSAQQRLWSDWADGWNLNFQKTI